MGIAMQHRYSQLQKFLQKMAMTPQMRQSILLLGMSVKDIADYVDTAVAVNPFLKKILDSRRALAGSPHNEAPEQSSKVNPRDTLLSQASMMGLIAKQLEIAEYLIDEMDENGYINTDIDEAAGRLSVDTNEIDEVLGAIQSMDPAGIGARDLRECLQLQLKRKSMMDSPEYLIVTSFLSELAQEDIGSIAKGLKISVKETLAAVKGVRKLNPRPASSMLAKETPSATPELVAHVKDKKIRLEINKGTVPGLKLYNPYESDFDIIKDSEARKFMKENMNAAKTLIDNLKRREDTLCKVAAFILNAQKEALAEKGRYIKTLTIKEVAKALGFHPSTISRAVSNKYIEINGKVVPLASLLSHGIRKENGEVESKASVRRKIEALVRAEDPRKPVSDAYIEEALKRDGIVVKRRTVAKYRDGLRILPSYLRKKHRTDTK